MENNTTTVQRTAYIGQGYLIENDLVQNHVRGYICRSTQTN